ncbi:MAG: hypothetical protein [Caudoviricetes sp.]|nr:MAG: hypothetical protein [Caudoviricetes sp.]
MINLRTKQIIALPIFLPLLILLFIVSFIQLWLAEVMEVIINWTEK